MFCTCTSMGLLGINAYKVAVEVDLSESFPGFDIVGLPDVAVKESRDRAARRSSTAASIFLSEKL